MSALHLYLDNSRSYHDFTHIGNMFEDLRNYFPEYNKNMVLKFAILYHDCFYVANYGDNEFNSAHLAVKEGGEEFTEDEQKEIHRLIMLTKEHKTDKDDLIGQVMIDLDLARLASDGYKTNSELIRKEFASASDEDWRNGRIAWLESFLSRETIFQSWEGTLLWEYDARKNMNKELDYLKGLLA